MTLRRLECILIGNASLLVTCGAELRAAGARVALVVTEDQAIEKWARGLDLECAPFDDALPGRLGPGAADYLFSIGNLRVLSGTWLALARRMAINFHDALLPAYRGLHATSWALMHQEIEHGVTWHVALPEVDAGDVLEQERFAVDPDETAFTLNAKCFEAGLRGFRRLIADIDRDQLRQRRLDLAGSSYFGRRRRPAAAGYVDWSRPLDQCDALVRALDFGPYPNPLGTPWSLRDGRVVRVDRATVAEVGAAGAAAYDAIPTALATRLGERHEAWCTEETDWVRRCRQLQPLPLGATGGAGGRRVVPFDLAGLATAGSARLAAAIGVWLARAFDQPVFDIGCRGEALDARLAGLEPWFESLPPLRVEVDLDQPFGECLARVSAALAAHHGRATFLRDVVHRYPALRGGTEDGVATRLMAALTIGEDAAAARDGDAALVIHLSPDGTACEWRVDTSRIQLPVEALQRQCGVFLQAALAAPDVAASRVPVVDAAERHRLIAEWNDTARPIPGAATIPDQFEAQAARTPDAPAVATWRGGVSYRELNRRSNQLARVLQARGVGPGVLVGLHMERSVDMVVGLLGILKAGAAYLPLDPDYPAERTRS